MEDQTELQDTLSPEVEAEVQDEALEPQQEPEENIVPKAVFDKLQAENQKLYARTKKAEAALKMAGPSKPTAQYDVEDIVNLRMDGYTAEEVDYIKKFARGTGKPLGEASKDPFVLAGIEGLRNVSKSESATPSPSNRSSVEPTEVKSLKDAKTDDERRAAFSRIKVGG